MHVLMFVPRYPYPVVGGLERQAHELSKALMDRGVHVDALTLQFDPAQSADEIVDGVRVLRVAPVSASPLMMAAALCKALFGYRHSADVIHIHNISRVGTIVSAIARLLAIPVITKLPNSGEFGIPGMRSRRLGRVQIAMLRRSAAIVAMSPASIAELKSINYPENQVLRIPNGVTVQPDTPVASQQVSGAVVVTYVGRLSPEKGLIDLLEAWANVQRAARRPSMLRLIGAGPQLGELQSLAAKLGIQGTTEFRGFSNNVSAELLGSNIFVLPSYEEGNSNAILEAMRAGLPIVATRVGGAEAQVGPEGADCLFEVGDRAALAERLSHLIDNDQQRIDRGLRLRLRSETLFSMEAVAASYHQAYAAIAAGRNTA